MLAISDSYVSIRDVELLALAAGTHLQATCCQRTPPAPRRQQVVRLARIGTFVAAAAGGVLVVVLGGQLTFAPGALALNVFGRRFFCLLIVFRGWAAWRMLWRRVSSWEATLLAICSFITPMLSIDIDGSTGSS